MILRIYLIIFLIFPYQIYSNMKISNLNQISNYLALLQDFYARITVKHPKKTELKHKLSQFNVSINHYFTKHVVFNKQIHTNNQYQVDSYIPKKMFVINRLKRLSELTKLFPINTIFMYRQQNQFLAIVGYSYFLNIIEKRELEKLKVLHYQINNWKSHINTDHISNQMLIQKMNVIFNQLMKNWDKKTVQENKIVLQNFCMHNPYIIMKIMKLLATSKIKNKSLFLQRLLPTEKQFGQFAIIFGIDLKIVQVQGNNIVAQKKYNGSDSKNTLAIGINKLDLTFFAIKSKNVVQNNKQSQQNNKSQLISKLMQSLRRNDSKLKQLKLYEAVNEEKNAKILEKIRLIEI